ncbi:MAG TPA: Gfo/Idh/MocA family oxidoreductase [Planctomycetota bacterium]|jgi:predicted dehydrogenase|nr:Gfo/Idh/MocA family oxidoreductase [Planctomycetota bacterium]
MTDQLPTDSSSPLIDRRRFVVGAGSLAALGMFFGGANVYAEEFTPAPTIGGGNVAPVGCAVIGLGEQGRAILTSLGYAAGANVVRMCDSYEGIHERAQELAPKAKVGADAAEVLADPAVQAVWICTPTHQHKDLVIAALKAGKHVYCEAPLAHTIDDARLIAQAAQTAKGQVFHSGLQQRTNPQHLHVVKFVRTGALGTVASGRMHWHKRTSWRRAAASDARAKALNWRLDKSTSVGLAGEIGIHQFDVASWFLKSLPTAVSGTGAIRAWKDGREVADTVQALLEFPDGLNVNYDATLANSFDGFAECFLGTDAAVLVRDHRAWMFKEADAAALGWEVYAYREKRGDDTGIALVADAIKIFAAGKQPGENREVDPKRTALVTAAEAFLDAIRAGKGVSACDALTGFQATVVGITANQAIAETKRLAFTPEMFAL